MRKPKYLRYRRYLRLTKEFLGLILILLTVLNMIRSFQ